MKHIQLQDALTKDTTPALLPCCWHSWKRHRQSSTCRPSSAIDSSAVSLLLACQRKARQRGIELSSCNLPAGLRSLTELYAVGELIPAEAGN